MHTHHKHNVIEWIPIKLTTEIGKFRRRNTRYLAWFTNYLQLQKYGHKQEKWKQIKKHEKIHELKLKETKNEAKVKKIAAQRRVPHHTENWPVQNLKMQYVLRSLKMHIDVPVETLTTRKKNVYNEEMM